MCKAVWNGKVKTSYESIKTSIRAGLEQLWDNLLCSFVFFLKWLEILCIGEQIGSGDRSERIRTYNFPQGRVTDHRVGITHHAINDVMQGESLDVFIDALLLQQEMDAIASFGSIEWSWPIPGRLDLLMLVLFLWESSVVVDSFLTP